MFTGLLSRVLAPARRHSRSSPTAVADGRTGLAYREKPPRDGTVSPVAAAIYGALTSTARTRPLRIVQVGANPSLADPIQPHFQGFGSGVEFLLIEAHPNAYRRLTEVFGTDPRATLVHAFVGSTGDRFFALSADLEEDYLSKRRRPADRISSGVYDHVAARVADRLGIEGDELDRAVVELDVPVRSLSTICDATGFESFEVLQIDAEGKDIEILDSIDLVRRGVRIVNFESTVDSAVEREAIGRLVGHGFMHIDGGTGQGDVLLVRTD